MTIGLMQPGSNNQLHDQAYQARPFIIPVFIPHMGCPHQCVFCNQDAITGAKRNIPSPEKTASLIDSYLKYKTNKRSAVQIAFYGGNFLGLKTDSILALLETADAYVKQGVVNSIRFSTRPDTIYKERLDLIKNYPVSTIELGAQSMDDQVLKASGRGHTALDTKEAAALLKKRNYELGIQMMVGLPEDSDEKALFSGRKIAGLEPDFVRIYPTLVIEKSRLADLYKRSQYTPLHIDHCVTLVKKLYLYFKENNIDVIRMGLQASEEFDEDLKIIAGPYHPAFGHLVYSEIFLDKAISIMDSLNHKYSTVTINVHPSSISKMRGLKSENIKFLKKRYQIDSIKVVPDIKISEDCVTVTSK